MYAWIPDHWCNGTVNTNGIRLHYWRTGGEKPPLVLLHGITDNGLCWRRAAERLQVDYDLIMVDGRGHGQSDKPETGYLRSDYATDTAGLIEQLGLGKSAVMGHSLGGGIGTVLAGSRPDLVCCLILEDPPYRTPADAVVEAARREHMKTWRAETLQRQTEMSHADMVAYVKVRSPNWHADEFEAWAQAKLDVSVRVFDGTPFNDWPENVAKIECPTLLVCADPELGAIVTLEAEALARSLNPHVASVRIAGAGHNVRREQLEPFMAAVEAFLRKHA